MEVQKYVLLVSPGEGLANMAPSLKEFDFRLMTTTELEDALTFIKSFRKLAMVIVDQDASEAVAASFIYTVRELHPRLPILWLAGEKLRQTELVKHMADVFREEPVNAEELHHFATVKLKEYFYPPVIVEKMWTSANDVLCTAFGIQEKGKEPFLKVNRTLLSDLSAMITFNGQTLMGHVIVSSSFEFAKVLHHRALGQEGEAAERVSAEDAGDLLSEMCNQLAGKVKEFFYMRGSLISIGLPYVLEGQDVILRHRAGTPSLAVAFEELDGSVFVELCFDKFDPAMIEEEIRSDLVESGVVAFL
jgi:CheY-specific phosphatase CheX